MKQDLKIPSSIGSKASNYRLNVKVLGLGVFSTKNVTFFFTLSSIITLYSNRKLALLLLC